MSLFEVTFTGGNTSPGAEAGTADNRGPRRGASLSGSGPGLSAAASAAARFALPLPRRGAGIGAFVLAVVTAGALAHVGVRLKGLEVAYDLGRERRVATEMEEQRRRLQIEIGMLKDPRRVIAIAREKLNMGPPAPEAIWRLGAKTNVPPPIAPGNGNGNGNGTGTRMKAEKSAATAPAVFTRGRAARPARTVGQ